MKKLVLVLICFCFAGVSFAGDAKPTQKQLLVINIEKLQNTADYAKSYMTALESQYKNFSIVYQKATKDLQAAQLELKVLEGKKKK